ncbi:MAG: hypothetical protein H6727_03690 [Myxococcales bacterium]|nr:hypothetical protein [Myxococcales bacterium]
MEPHLLWSHLQKQLHQAMQQLPKLRDPKEVQELQQHLQQLEDEANTCLQHFPILQGKHPYDADRWTLAAGILLCEISRQVHHLRTKQGDPAATREAFRKDAMRLLNLRADHGRFFSVTLDQQIRQVEEMYLALRKKEEARQAKDPD